MIEHGVCMVCQVLLLWVLLPVVFSFFSTTAVTLNSGSGPQGS